MKEPIVYALKSKSSDPDTLHLHEAMKEPDADRFVDAIIKEINGHSENDHWEVIPANSVPIGSSVLPAVWAMRRVRDLVTNGVRKFKARINLDGSKQVFGKDYTETYSPVVNWIFIRFLFILALLNNWHTAQIDFVMAYPQAKLDTPKYMHLPRGIVMSDENEQKHVLKIKQNIYGGKDSGRIFYKHVAGRLVNNMKCTKSAVDDCVFYRGHVIFCFYVDDGLVFFSDVNEGRKFMDDLKKTFKIEEKGDVNDYLGVNICTHEDGSIEMRQPQLIKHIIDDCNIIKNFKPPEIPARSSTKPLNAHVNSPPFDAHFHYRSLIGKCNYLEKSTRPDIAFATHQCARFSQSPKKQHGHALTFLAKYLSGTADKGLIMKPDTSKSLECFVDADFSGLYDPSIPNDVSTSKSRTGFVIRFAGCNILWRSVLQTTISLSSTEAEYVALSTALREVIPLIEFLKELKSLGIATYSTHADVHCKCFEDNSGALELARLPKIRPRTKHINLSYHHFRSHVQDGSISIHPIKSEDQLADIFTKPLEVKLFQRLRKLLIGW